MTELETSIWKTPSSTGGSTLSSFRLSAWSLSSGTKLDIVQSIGEYERAEHSSLGLDFACIRRYPSIGQKVRINGELGGEVTIVGVGEEMMCKI